MNDVFEWVEGALPSEETVQVAINLGANSDKVKDMRLNGMDRSTYYHVVPASAAERHISEKYGIPFKAVDSWIESSDAGNRVAVTVEAESGPFSHERFTVYVDWGNGVPAAYSENYFCSLRSEEYRAYVSGLLGNADGEITPGVYAIPSLGSFLWVGDEFDANTPIEEVAAKCSGNLAIVFGPREGMTESAYREELAFVLAKAADVNPGIFFESGYVEQLAPYDSDLDAARAEGYLHSTDLSHRALCIWRLSGAASDGLDGALRSY